MSIYAVTMKRTAFWLHFWLFMASPPEMWHAWTPGPVAKMPIALTSGGPTFLLILLFLIFSL